MRRTEARESFMQLLFQMEVQNDFSEKAKERFITEQIEGSSQLDYFNALYKAVLEHLTQIDAMIESASSNWKISRLAKVDLAVLRLSLAEILYIEEVPESVSINEAVELAKKFGGEDSGKYVNGILGKISRGKHEQ